MKLFNIGTLVVVLAALGAPALSGCGSDDISAEKSLGSLSLSLTGTSNTGATYRLRNAFFVINGATPATLSSEINPDATSISQDLAVGDYIITLDSGWFLEKLSGGVFSTVDAILTSANPIGFHINDQGTTGVAYQFRAGDDVVQLGHGTLIVTIGIEDDDDGSCDPGQIDCGGVCVDPTNDPNNCGACNQVCPAGASCTGGVCVNGATFSASFTQGQDSQACGEWEAFTSSLAGGAFSFVSLQSEFGAASCSGPAAQQLCDALANGLTTFVNCDGRDWSVDVCGEGLELTADGFACGCNFPGFSARPCIGDFNPNWGGVNTDTCSGPSQTISVTCQ